MEALMPLVYGPMYSKVYTSTLQILPGAVFLLGAALTFPAILIFG
jgi:MFS transporter, PCFT/HCP family, solute carrier family 46, member 3